ncbi:MAG: type III-A CRISPR-associated RAMP protein Csm5 [Bacteroidota bacterium]
MKLKLYTLTPLHIGTGEELAPLNYIFLKKNGTFYRLSHRQIIAFVNSLPNGIDNFSNWIGKKYLDLKQTKNNLELSDIDKEINLFDFANSLGRQNVLFSYLEEYKSDLSSAKVSIDSWTRNRYNRNNIYPLGRIREAIKNHTQQPIVPGTSIKGAIRTAIFHHVLSNHLPRKKFMSLVKNQLNNSRVTRERFALPIIHEIFYCGVLEDGEREAKLEDEKMDLFKLVRVSDGQQRALDNAMSFAKINLYLVEKKRARDRSKTYFEATQQRQTSYAEVISPGQAIHFELDFDIDFLVCLKPLLSDDGVRQGGQYVWVGLRQKVQHLFGLDLATLTWENKEEKRQEVLQFLLDKVQAFSQAQLQASQSWLEHFQENDKNDRYSTSIRQGFDPVLAYTQQPLVHLGYATGFDGMTALLYILQTNHQALFKRVMEQFNIGNKPGNRGKYIANPDRFPKSKRLVELKNQIAPLGWAIILDAQAPAPAPATTETATTTAATARTLQPELAPKALEPEYFTGKVNYKKPPLLDAVVIKSGRPNTVKVYWTEENSPEMKLDGYRNPLEVGKILKVKTVFTRKIELRQVSYGGRKR